MSGGTHPFEAVARGFVEAFNRRDADSLVALCDPAIDWRPSLLVGARRTYRGHEGIRRWVADLGESHIAHTALVREVRVIEPDGFVVVSEVLAAGQRLSPSAMLGRLGGSGLIVAARAYLSDEELLEHLGHLDLGALGPEAEGAGERACADRPELLAEEPRGPARRAASAA